MRALLERLELLESSQANFIAVFMTPNGPITARFTAPDSRTAAIAVAKKKGRDWYDDAKDDLKVGGDASESEVKSALKKQGYVSAWPRETSEGPSIYRAQG
jgi:hypothetical protein